MWYSSLLRRFSLHFIFATPFGVIWGLDYSSLSFSLWTLENIFLAIWMLFSFCWMHFTSQYRQCQFMNEPHHKFGWREFKICSLCFCRIMNFYIYFIWERGNWIKEMFCGGCGCGRESSEKHVQSMDSWRHRCLGGGWFMAIMMR